MFSNMKQKKPPSSKKYEDNPRVVVFDNNIEVALRKLRPRIQKAGILKGLKFRERHPSKRDRRREKRKRAAMRAVRANLLMKRSRTR